MIQVNLGRRIFPKLPDRETRNVFKTKLPFRQLLFSRRPISHNEALSSERSAAPALQIKRHDRGVRYLDSERLEVEALPLVAFVLRAKPRIVVSEVGSIPRVIGAGNAARGDLD
jgi:hypothetical protein